MNIKQKNVYLKIRVGFCTAVIIFFLLTGSVRADDGKKQLMDMATKIAEAKQFSVSMLMGYDAVQKSGQKIEFSEMRKVLVSRPNHMRVDTQLSNGDTKGMLFDGKVITLFDTLRTFIRKQNDRVIWTRQFAMLSVIWGCVFRWLECLLQLFRQSSRS